MNEKGEGEDDPLKAYLREISAFPLLMPDEELRIAKAAADGDASARETLVQANLRLVVSLARKYRDRAPLFNLIQEGNIGLKRAVEQFGPARGVRFSSFATPFIREAIEQAIDGSPPPEEGRN